MHAEREPEPDAEARRRATEERVRSMQFEQVVLEGGKPKKRVSLFSAYLVTLFASILPLRVRTAFALAINFVFNQTSAVLQYAAALISRSITTASIFLVYWLVVGPTSLLARLLGADDLRERPAEGSMFQDKDPPDTTEARFKRQY